MRGKLRTQAVPCAHWTCAKKRSRSIPGTSKRYAPMRAPRRLLVARKLQSRRRVVRRRCNPGMPVRTTVSALRCASLVRRGAQWPVWAEPSIYSPIDSTRSSSLEWHFSIQAVGDAAPVEFVGDSSGAEPFINKALDIDSHSATAQTALGRLYAGTGRLDDAIAAFRRAISLDDGHSEAHNRLGSILRDAGELDEAIAAFDRAIAAAPNRPDIFSNLLLTLQCSDRVPAREIAERHRDFGRHFSKMILPLPSIRVAPMSARRLKIGYLSSNFRRHAVAKFFEPLVASHDKGRFEIHCYYNYPVADEVTERIRDRAEHFSSVCGMRDGNVAAQVRRDGIDILVDLDGHTAPNRLPVFFLRPAPVQVSWVGYLATTGIAAIDYRLTDARADPPGTADELHTETLWRLPITASIMCAVLRSFSSSGPPTWASCRAKSSWASCALFFISVLPSVCLLVAVIALGHHPWSPCSMVRA